MTFTKYLSIEKKTAFWKRGSKSSNIIIEVSARDTIKSYSKTEIDPKELYVATRINDRTLNDDYITCREIP